MEPRFGRDFSRVRVHTDTQAQAAAADLGALAWTAGSNIAFGPGQYAPGTQAGDRLLAHELAHVAQQQDVSGFLGIQRQAASAREGTAGTMEDVLAKLNAGTLDLADAAGWAILAANTKSLAAYESDIHLYFQEKVKAGQITFETITEDQRKVFGTIKPVEKETLRKIAIQNSKLFQVLTEMQLETNGAAERVKVAAERMSPNKDGDYYENSLAAMFADYLILPEVLIAEVTGSSVLGNEEMAKYVRQLKVRYKSDPGRIKEDLIDQTKDMACGLGNLFALAASRGFAEPTKAGAKKWLKETVLGKASGKALVQVSNGWFHLETNEVLTDLSRRHQPPKKDREDVALTPVATEKTKARFQSVMEKSAKQINARLGLVQGRGAEGHMYIVYKDIDGVWRTMDMYMGIADLPGGGLPYDKGSATKKSWHKLISD